MIETSSQVLPHGITLSCRTVGARGRPVLLFLHGFPEAAFVWDGLMTYFSQPENGGFRCVAPNLRGFEQSSAPSDVAAYRPKQLVKDIAALIDLEGGQIECLIAHDWGGAVAWNLAAAQPDCMKKLAIINSPHPGTFLRELQHSPTQQAASAYMNFLIRPDAEALLAENDFRRLWEFFTQMGAVEGPHAWLTEAVKARYRAVWTQGLTGPCNYYRASPLRPPRPGPPHNDPAAAAVTIPQAMLEIHLPTLVIWAMGDTALPPALLDGLDQFVPEMTLHRVEGATHWIVHEQPELVARYLQQFLR
ncbi:MAG: alpha/beta fold hydrolase [Polaromonas sp.]|uniref:alpha/beta fold hydrolase n=1 Tax=Polaromonas sp. TaxID=1869339 RepID=UPI0017DA8B2F|nr:alpha/beta fold hydrolase [Polaromonas sp.]NMM11781.1 alpha/beta fold hydrolase [Polaromonas sp.]